MRAVKRGKRGNAARIEAVAATLENYARRGVFRGFSRGPVERGQAHFRLVWHRDRVFEFVFDPARRALRFPVVLPDVPADSEMYRSLKEFIRERQSEAMPEHRRIDPRLARVRPLNRGGDVSLTLSLAEGDDEYGTRKLVHLVHEIYMTFLLDGRYFDYVVETFNLDPDRM